MSFLDSYLGTDKVLQNIIIISVHKADFIDTGKLLGHNLEVARYISTIINDSESCLITNFKKPNDTKEFSIDRCFLATTQYHSQNRGRFELVLSIDALSYKTEATCDTIIIKPGLVEFESGGIPTLSIRTYGFRVDSAQPNYKEIYYKFECLSPVPVNMLDIQRIHAKAFLTFSTDVQPYSTAYSFKFNNKHIIDEDNQMFLPKPPIVTRCGSIIVKQDNGIKMCYTNGQEITEVSDKAFLYWNAENKSSFAIKDFTLGTITVFENFVAGPLDTVNPSGMLMACNLREPY